MAIESVNRKYTLTDSELSMFTSNLCVAMESDLADLAEFGVTQDNIDDLKDLGDDFEEFPTDEVLVAYITGATESKDAKAAEIKEQIRDMVARCQMKWGANSWQEKTLAVTGFNNFTDDKLLVASRRVHTQMTEFLPELASTGLTLEILNALATLNESFESAMTTVKKKIVEREKKTVERINLGNELYDEVVKYCEIGKRVYAMSNPAKYNQYIIYTSTSPGSLTAPQNFMFDPVNYDFSWSAVENATSYILQESTDGTNWTEYWSGAETTCAYEESPTTMMYFRVLAHNASGNGPASSVIQYDFAPTLVAPGSFHYNPETYYFSWTAVANAEYYEFQYRAQTNPTWNSLNAGNATSFYHVDPAGDYLARVRAVAGTTMGPWSIELEYTVGPIQPD